MTQYIIRRVLQAIPLLFLIALFVFFLTKAAGDPLAERAADPRLSQADQALMRARFGLDDPLPMQFVYWLFGDDWYTREINLGDDDGDGVNNIIEEQGIRKGIVRGDLGISISWNGREVSEVIMNHLPRTLLLGSTALIVTIVASFLLGIYTALNQYTLFDNIFTAGAFFTYSVPVFLVALILVQIFAVQFHRWGLPRLPVEGMYSPRGNRTLDDLILHLILPTLSLALIQIAGYSRYIRATMLEVINQDYIRTAHSKGLSEKRVIYLHALKNASLPIVTLIGLSIPFILSGAIITETIFSWQGMGWMFIRALTELDQALISATTLLISVAVVFFQLVTDIMYAVLDPRIRYS